MIKRFGLQKNIQEGNIFRIKALFSIKFVSVLMRHGWGSGQKVDKGKIL